MSPRRSNQISNAFRKLKLRKQLAKQKSSETGAVQRPQRPQLRLVANNDLPAGKAKTEKPA